MNIWTLLDAVIASDSSDLHISVGTPPAMRLPDGSLAPVSSDEIVRRDCLELAPGIALCDELDERDVDQALREVLPPMQYEAFRVAKELDFGFSYKKMRFRGNAYRDMKGPAAAFRRIPMKVRSIEELGLPKVLKDVARMRRGLFLVTGPTGFAKSTTLAAIVNEINHTRRDHVLTIEDPIEFVHEPALSVIHQREVGRHTADFATALRHALRQDPDVILIGEMRDLETISIALRAAETGHLVLGTLHTRGATYSLERMIDVFPASQQQQIRVILASVLIGICSQTLVPTWDSFSELGPKPRLERYHKGLTARVCATEILLANPAVRNCIRENKNENLRNLMQTGAESGMYTLEQCLADFVRSKVISLEDAMTHAADPAELERILTTPEDALS